MWMVLKQLSCIALAVSLLNGCVIQQSPTPGAAAFAPMQEIPAAPLVGSAGSLFRDDTALTLYTDQKAHRVGDIIEVILSESTTSQKSSNVSTKKENTLDIQEQNGGVGAILGSGVSLGNYSLLTDLIGKRDFKGGGDADQSNSLNGSITVTVAGVQSNGNLVVRGEKWITLNKGDEYIRISGVLRPDDITPSNTVVSTKLANARITYSGTGTLAEAGRQGWLSRFFNSEYFPF